MCKVQDTQDNEIDPKLFWETSPYKEDGTYLIGKDPRHIESSILKLLPAPERPIKAIRAFCIDCSGGSKSEARKCTAYECALWRLRMGTNPLHGKALK